MCRFAIGRFVFQTTGGASSIAVGKTGRIKKSLAVVGGQSALHGFDENGNEPLWTLTGDNVSVLALFDINKDGQVEVSTALIVASNFSATVWLSVLVLVFQVIAGCDGKNYQQRYKGWMVKAVLQCFKQSEWG